MHQLLKYSIVGFISFIAFSSYGQISLDGIYQRNDTTTQANLAINRMTLLIKGDSIWFSKNYSSKANHPKGTNFFLYKGTIHKYKDFYYASLLLMECDTCPTFWKYTTKTEDSIGTEVLYQSDKIDTVIINGDTSYQQAEILSDKVGNVEVRRMSELLFTVSKTQDLLINDKLYSRKRTK